MRVVFFAPNLVGYCRLALLVGVAAFASSPRLAVALYCLCFALDGVDGWAARRLGQETSFGAFLDVAVDNAGRALVWWMSGSPLAALVPALEGLTFAALQSTGPGGAAAPAAERADVLASATWKERAFIGAPWLCRTLTANGFRTPQGALVIAGLHFLPAALYLRQQEGVEGRGWTVLISLLAAGRAAAAYVELWVLQRHLRNLLKHDTDARRGRAG
jgi:phosphatidylglycerophosphate synthase